MAAWLRYDWCSSLVLALGHFLWQGVLLAALLAVVLKATKNVAVRYWLSLSALLLMAACPVATLAWLAEPASPVEIPAVVDVIAEPLEPTPLVTQSLSGPDAPDLPMPIEVESSPNVPDVIPEPVTSMPFDQRSWWQRFAPQLTTAYASGVGLMLLRLAVGLWGGRRLCRRAIPVTDGSLLSALQRQSNALGLKLQPLLAYCERVTVPTVVGVLKPMILLPVSIASGLSPEQIESVLAHELAHLRRYDHLVNLLQRVIESLLFFHPAVWWVSHRVREEREHCCDDLVIACGAMPLDYAKSLLRVAELSRASRLGRSISAISLLATGDKPSNLRQRIARLLGESATPSLRLSPRVLMFALCAPVIALLASLQSGASNALPDKPQEAEVAKDPTPRPESYVAALANGMRVEFVGLAAMESDAKNWWKPDGSPLGEVPAHDNATSSVSGRKMRRVLIRVHGNLSYLDVASPGMSTLRRRDDQAADGPFVRLDGGYAYLPGEKTGRIEVGIATQPQSPVRRLDAKGGAADGSPHAGGIKFDSVGLPALWISKSNGQELPETAEQKKENDQRRVQTQVLWSAPKSLRTFDLDLTLIDVDGKAHQPAGRGSYFETDETRRQQINRGTFVFDVPISRVASFEYRTRLYQHWVTFENVSLQRDELTDVTIKVESDASIESQPVVPQLTKNFSEVLTGQQADQVAWSHDSQQLYATGSFQKLTVWKHGESGWKPTTLDRDSFKNSIAASRKSPLIVVGTNLGSAEVWDATTQKRLQLFQPSPQYSVYAVAISADDKLVAACGTNGTVSVFDRETQRPIALLAEPDHARMSSLAFSPDGKMLAAMDRQGYVALWTIPDGKPLAQWPKIAGEDCSVFWSRDSKQLAVSGWGSVTLIEAHRGSQPKVVQAPEELLSRHPADEGGLRSGPQPGGIKFASIPAISADLRTIASIAPDGNIGLWDVAHSGVIAKLQSPNAALIKDAQGGGLRHLTFSPDGLNLACTTQQGDVVIWQLAQNKMEAGKVQPGAAVDPEKATVDPTKPAPQPAATSAPPKGLEFLAPYPKLHGLSLNMTEPQFLEIVKQQELKATKTGEGDTTAYHMGLGDGLTLIVMFRNDGTCRGIQRIRGEEGAEQVKPPVIGAVIQLNPLPVVGDFSKVDDPDVLLDQLAKAPLPSLAPQSGGGFFQQEGAPPQAMYVSLWENQYAGNDKLDPRIRRLIELGDRAALRVLQRLNGLAASDALATHLTLVLRSAGTTESVPALIKLLKTSLSTVLDGTQSLDDAQKRFQASVTQVAATSALWKLTRRKHVFTPDQWEKWWQSVKPDFVVPRERQRPEFVSGVTLERVNSLANDLATNEVAARERLISLGPAALPHLLTLLAAELPKPPLNAATLDAAKLSPQSKRLAWVIDELGATDKLPAKLRRDYFTQRFSDDGTYAGMYPIDEDALCRALSHCSFADYCSVFLEADSQGDVASHMKHIKWPLEIYAAYCRRFSKISPPNLGGWSNNAHWNKVVPAEDPAGEIESAVPILLAALKDNRVERRSSAAKLAAAIGFCSTAKPETLIVALRDAWLVEADEKVRPEFAFAMCRFQTPFVVKEVTNGMLSDRPEIVSDCAALMDWIPIQLNDETRPAFERLVELTRHENEKLRNRAVRSLRGKAVQLLNPELLRLSQDQSVDIRKECAYALRDKPDPKFADILFQLADDPDEQVRIEALTSIANLDHPESMNRLVPHLRDKKVQGYAVSAVANMGGKDALPLLMSELNGGNDVGGMIYQHLRRLTGEKFEGKPEPWLAWWKQQKAAPKPDKDSAATSLPDGLEFLRPYPKLHGLSLNMTEPQFLEIIKQQELKATKTGEGDKVQHHVSLGDGLTLIVMFDKDGKCKGIQRVRGADDPPSESDAIDPNGEIHGQLLGKNDQPVVGATIACGAVINNSLKGGGANAVTDAEGRYRLKAPSPGIYNVWLKQHSDPFWTAAADDGLFVEGGRITTSKMQLIRGSMISGTLVATDEKPLSNITVYCYSLARPQSGATVQSVTTNDKGEFAFWLVPGRAYVYANERERGHAEAAIEVPRNGRPEPTEPVKLVLKQEERKLGGDSWLKQSSPGTRIVRHENAKDVTGTVVDADDQPIAGANVFRIDGSIVTTNDKGEFTVSLDRGTQVIMYAAQPGYRVWFGTPTAGDVLKIVLEKKSEAPGIATHAATSPFAPPAQLPPASSQTTRSQAPIGNEKKSEKNDSGGPPELRTLRKPAVLLPDHWIMQAVGFDNGGKELVTASNQSFFTIRRWDIVGMKLISEIKLQADKHGRAVHPRTFKLSGDRRRVIGATDAYVGIWDATTGKLLKQLPFAPKDGIYTCEIDQLDCTADLSVIVGHRAQVGRLTLSYDAHVLVWDGATGNVLQTVIDKGATDLKAIDLSTDGKRLVTTNGGGAKIWETSTGQLLRSIPNDNSGRKHSEPDVSSQYTSHVWSVQFSPDGKQVAMGDILGVKLLDTTSGKLLQQLEGPYRYSSSGGPGLVFSKDGQWLARLGTQEKVGVDGDKHRYVVPVWSTRTGARLFELHTEANDAAFSDDGQRLAVVFSDMQQALSVWTLSGDAANVEQTAGPGPHSRQDRVEENGHYVGKTAAEFIDKFKPVWGDTKHGLQYGIALTKPQRQFRSGERVPLVVFFRNTSDRPIKFNTAPDFFGNVPKVLNAKGEQIALENIPLLGRIPHYHEKLEPGEALGPFYLSFGLDENPRPGQQHWHPYFKTPVAGPYKLTHSVWINVVSPQDGEPVQRDDIVTGQIDFEIINGG